MIGRALNEVTDMVQAMDGVDEVPRSRPDEELRKLADGAYPSKDDPQLVFWDQYMKISTNLTASLFARYKKVVIEVTTREPVWEIACDELGIDYTDIVYEKATDEGIAKITINRPERRNAFQPQTIKELIRAFNDARDDNSVGVIILTGKDGLSPIDLMVETETHRATPGGTGCVKTIGNYAAVLKAQSSAKAKGYSDVLYLDHSCAVFYLFHGAAGFKNHLD
ncbi:hypothetical protein POM88_010042 [Heracleum sosnowskyi]|uniref:Enoyl-CoA hydratase/isomerase family protein n=1 Tax=Heracleum sosnowskyi TaxID=360622 RepID=A0AAD8J9X0_9APIA|nr:hypothetical protein POM88_010042 [Heracleum sosnowskyi]